MPVAVTGVIATSAHSLRCLDADPLAIMLPIEWPTTLESFQPSVGDPGSGLRQPPDLWYGGRVIHGSQAVAPKVHTNGEGLLIDIAWRPDCRLRMQAIQLWVTFALAGRIL